MEYTPSTGRSPSRKWVLTISILVTEQGRLNNPAVAGSWGWAMAIAGQTYLIDSRV